LQLLSGDKIIESALTLSGYMFPQNIPSSPPRYPRRLNRQTGFGVTRLLKKCLEFGRLPSIIQHFFLNYQRFRKKIVGDARALGQKNFGGGKSEE
jgi:hypothetical protein